MKISPDHRDPNKTQSENEGRSLVRDSNPEDPEAASEVTFIINGKKSERTHAKEAKAK
jgi:hypothetical protein